MLRLHVEDAATRKRFEIFIADDFSAHKTGPVGDLVWDKGAFLLVLGGGVTGGPQPCDVGLNQGVRRKYGFVKANIKMYRSRTGDNMAHLSESATLEMCIEIWRSEAVHVAAAQSF